MSKEDSIDVIKFLHTFLRILACPACSRSALNIEEQLKLLDSLLITITLKGERIKIITRARIAQYIYHLHNEVNKRLGKSVFGTNWRDSLKERKKWAKHLFVFLFSVIWNYPKQDPPMDIQMLYEYFFVIALPSILKYTEIDKFYKAYMLANDFNKTKGNKHKMFEWIYKLKKSIGIICGPTWEYDDVCQFMTAMEARSDCMSGNGCQ